MARNELSNQPYAHILDKKNGYARFKPANYDSLFENAFWPHKGDRYQPSSIDFLFYTSTRFLVSLAENDIIK